MSDKDAPPDVKKTALTLPADGRPSGSIGRMRRVVLVAAGILCVGLGLLGVVVPVLPTTPFLLLAAACFLRSSERLHRWLLGHPIFGKHLRSYRDGLPLSSKVATIVLLWGTLAVSAFVAVPVRLWPVHLLLLAVGIGVTVHIMCLKTRRRKDVS